MQCFFTPYPHPLISSQQQVIRGAGPLMENWRVGWSITYQSQVSHVSSVYMTNWTEVRSCGRMKEALFLDTTACSFTIMGLWGSRPSSLVIQKNNSDHFLLLP